MVKKAFLVTFVGRTGRKERELLSVPADDKFYPVTGADGKTNLVNARILSEQILKRMYPRSRDTIRIVKIERDSAEDIMTDKLKNIKVKYNIGDQQNDAADTLAARLDAASKLKVSAQKALDALFAASRKASAAVSAYNKAIARGGIEANKVGKMVDYHDVLNNLKSGANTRI